MVPSGDKKGEVLNVLSSAPDEMGEEKRMESGGGEGEKKRPLLSPRGAAQMAGRARGHTHHSTHNMALYWRRGVRNGDGGVAPLAPNSLRTTLSQRNY